MQHLPLFKVAETIDPKLIEGLVGDGMRTGYEGGGLSGHTRDNPGSLGRIANLADRLAGRVIDPHGNTVYPEGDFKDRYGRMERIPGTLDHIDEAAKAFTKKMQETGEQGLSADAIGKSIGDNLGTDKFLNSTLPIGGGAALGGTLGYLLGRDKDAKNQTKNRIKSALLAVLGAGAGGAAGYGLSHISNAPSKNYDV